MEFDKILAVAGEAEPKLRTLVQGVLAREAEHVAPTRQKPE